MPIIDRDIRGRMFGGLLFAAFLSFHIFYAAQGWSTFDIVAKINSLLITATIIFFLAAYFLRKRPLRYAQGFRETLFPLFCAGLPLVIYHSSELLRYVPVSAHYYPRVYSLFGLTDNSLLSWNLVSMALVLAGNFLTFLGIISLRRSFSIMVEAREPVFTGLYAYVRHPLYVGEVVATAGVLVFRFSPVNAALFVLFILSQVVRAALEEKKLLSVFPAYEDYRRKTGAFFLRFPRSGEKQFSRQDAKSQRKDTPAK